MTANNYMLDDAGSSAAQQYIERTITAQQYIERTTTSDRPPRPPQTFSGPEPEDL